MRERHPRDEADELAARIDVCQPQLKELYSAAALGGQPLRDSAGNPGSREPPPLDSRSRTRTRSGLGFFGLRGLGFEGIPTEGSIKKAQARPQLPLAHPTPRATRSRFCLNGMRLHRCSFVHRSLCEATWSGYTAAALSNIAF